MVSAGGKEIDLSLKGDYTGDYFTVGGIGFLNMSQITLTSVGTPCYCPGTLIETERGEVRIEELAIGDRLRTVGGQLRDLKWIGRRSYDGRFVAGRKDILPVTFEAGSLGGGLPKRVLTVSPLHAMYVDGKLIPAGCLVNGEGITQARSAETISYLHLELETHDVIFAEGAPSETFIDDGSRGMFLNAHEYAGLYPDAVAEPPLYCAPRLESGEELEEIRQRLRRFSPVARAAFAR